VLPPCGADPKKKKNLLAVETDECIRVKKPQAILNGYILSTRIPAQNGKL